MDTLEELKRKAAAYDQICLVKRAQMVVKAAKRAGIIAPQPCAHCGRASSEVPIYAHHENYNEPLRITWLCRKCHHKEHVRLGWGAPPPRHEFRPRFKLPPPLMPPIPEA